MSAARCDHADSCFYVQHSRVTGGRRRTSAVRPVATLREEREYLRNDDGTLILDDLARPVYNLTQRVVLNPNLMSMPRAKQQTIRKMRIKRRAEGDEIELEMYDRHKAIMDLATLAGLRPQPTPAAASNEKEVYDEYSHQLEIADEQHAERLRIGSSTDGYGYGYG